MQSAENPWLAGNPLFRLDPSTSYQLMTAPPHRNGILAAGNFIVDRVKLIDIWPSQDALATILSEENCNGGGPFNLLVDLARLYLGKPPFPLRAAGLVGDDADGRWIRNLCCSQGIDDSQLRSVSGIPTSYTDVMTVEGTGRRTFFHQRGANAVLDEFSVTFAEVPARIFYLGYLLLLDALDTPRQDGETGASKLMARAREEGMITAMDLVSEESQRFRQIIGPALRHTDILLANEFEASRLSGVTLGASAVLDGSAVNAASELLRMGVRQAVVIHTPMGALAMLSSGGVFFQPSVAVPDSEIRGAVGAGDAFAAGFLCGWHEFHPVEECLRLGSVVAAASLRHPSASGGVLPWEDCLALAETWGWRTFG